jgi:uncharacterized RDD family membrane protein YckC
MSDHEQASATNIYAAPNADLSSEVQITESPLAGLGQRFGASLIDTLILMAINFSLIIWYFGSWYKYLNAVQDQTFNLQLSGALLGLVVFALINGKFLADNGQTIGKKLLGIKIVRTDGSKLSLQRFFTHRYLPLVFMPLIPVVGMFVPLIDVLFIFRDSRQCLHDQIADTIVVQA